MLATAVSTSDQTLCRYHNQPPQFQVVRSTNIVHWHYEQVVFPRERFLFEAPASAELGNLLSQARASQTYSATCIQGIQRRIKSAVEV